MHKIQKGFRNKRIFIQLAFSFVVAFCSTIIFTSPAFAAAVPAPAPADEINSIIERVIQIMTQIGSAVLLLFIVRDAFTIMEKRDDPMVRSMILRDVFLLIVSAIFLFNPNLILDAIKFIANV
jgi:arginine exporter protein ArgO